MNWTKKDLDQNAKLSVLEKTSFAFGNAGNVIGQALIAYYLLFFCTDILGMDAGVIATLMLVTRVFDGVSDIAMGYIIDRTHNKKGKARVWLIRSIVPYFISVVALFLIPAGASAMVQYVWFFVFYNLSSTFIGTMMNTSYNSMLSLVTKNPAETGILGNIAMIGAIAAYNIVGSYTLKIVNIFGTDVKAWRIPIRKCLQCRGFWHDSGYSCRLS